MPWQRHSVIGGVGTLLSDPWKLLALSEMYIFVIIVLLTMYGRLAGLEQGAY
ncbi:hypothetical protein BDZ97DRAFT_1778705 [Flammula alnicola]|nr:hypothetical protein BDZ97DRAFT_1778705 [Flammula alnicola]